MTLSGEPYRQIAEWQEARVKDALGREFRSTSSRIVVRRPGWMPDRLYRFLMRTIVIEERPAQRAPRAQRRKSRVRAR